jgi:uncharacterized repeat protein (TIGR01451 family)
VQVVLNNGSTTASGSGVDYTLFGSGAALFADGSSTPQSFNITIVDDPTVEAPETIVLDLSLPVGATVGAPATHTVTIIDNDVAPASADVSIAKVKTTSSVTQGNPVTFTITVTNSGPDAAANVVVNDTLPAQLTFVSATPSQGSCNAASPVICNLGTLNSSASATITLIATMTGTGLTTNTASVTSSTADSDPADNSSQAQFTIAAAAANIPIPALDPRMLAILAAAIAALGIVGVRQR